VEPRSARAPGAGRNELKCNELKRNELKRNGFIETAGLRPAF